MMLLAAGLLNAQTSGYNPDSPDEPFMQGYAHTLYLNVTPAIGGDFYGFSKVTIVEGDTMTIYVYPKGGFRFVEWRENGQVVSTVNPIVYTMGTSSSRLTAVLTYDPTAPADPYIGSFSHRLKLIASPSNAGYFDTDNSNYMEIPEDSSRMIHAYPKGGFRFVNWTRNGVVVSNANPYRYVMGSSNDALVANFVYDPVNPNNPGGGEEEEKYLFEDIASICEGESYQWRGKSYNTAGVYYDSLKSVDNRDSVYKLTLTVNPIITKNLIIDVCANEQLPAWATGFAPGRYYHIDTMTASTGCDSIINTTLNINRTYFYSQSVRMSSADVPYSWHGRSLSVSGTYYDSLLTTKGCDSVYQLNITFIDPYLFSDTVSICQGENYLWRGRRYSTTGIYYDSLKTADNIDSVYRLMLTVNPVVITPVNLTACANDEMPSWAADAVAGNTYHHYDTLVASTGCDSIIHTALKVNPTYFNQQSVTWPSAAGNYNWHGKTITGSGIYYDSLTTVITGCDSVFQLNITFADKYLFEESHAICQGDYYDWRGQRYTQAGVYYDSLKTADQVDSIYKLTLTVNQNYFFLTVHTICQGETYRWHDMDCTTAGVYYDSLLTTAGCDSVYELTLTVNPTYYVQERHAICQGDVYQWHNRNLNAAGVYYDSLTTATGCDSVYELTLRVDRTYFVQEQYSICQGDVYQWHNRSLSTAGVYYDSLTTTAGCDSVYVLTLTVNASYFIQEQYSICEGDYYQWHYRNLNTDGVYYDSLFTTEGCDSVYELTLTVNPTYLVEDSAELAEDGSGYMWHGKTYSVAGDYVDSLSTVFGCDSICILHLSDPIHSGIDETSRIIDVKVVPNPVKAGGTAYISADWTDEEIDGMTIEVITATGAVVSRITPETQTTTLGGISLQGIYFIRITTGTEDVYIRKLIVQ